MRECCWRQVLACEHPHLISCHARCLYNRRLGNPWLASKHSLSTSTKTVVTLPQITPPLLRLIIRLYQGVDVYEDDYHRQIQRDWPPFRDYDSFPLHWLLMRGRAFVRSGKPLLLEFACHCYAAFVHTFCCSTACTRIAS